MDETRCFGAGEEPHGGTGVAIRWISDQGKHRSGSLRPLETGSSRNSDRAWEWDSALRTAAADRAPTAGVGSKGP